MTKNIKDIIDYSEGYLSKSKMQKFESDVESNIELQNEFLLYKQINEYMRGRFDLEEVNNDRDLQDIDQMVKESIYQYQQNQGDYEENEKFIKDALHKSISDKALEEEIYQIKQEIHEHDLNEISEGWVKEWLENNQDRNSNENIKEFRDYISNSLVTKKNRPTLKIIHKVKENLNRSATFRVLGLSAAALITGILLIWTLIPSDNPEKLYEAYYKPMITISPVTRSYNSIMVKQYADAIEMYNKGNYKEASYIFDEMMQENPTFIAPYFFQGITQLELGNYERAISLLSTVTSQSKDFMKEAQWYLGLCYLKTGEKNKARTYFEILSESGGFYQDQAKELLRRLK